MNSLFSLSIAIIVLIDILIIIFVARYTKNKMEKFSEFFLERVSSNISELTSRFSILRPYYYLEKNVGLTFIDENLFFYVATEDRGITPHIIATGVWEKNNTKVFKTLLKDRKNIIDAGANLGYYTIIAASQNRKYKRDGKIYCIEANPDLAPYIISSIRTNNFFSSIEFVNKFLSDKESEIDFISIKDSKGGSAAYNQAFMEIIEADPRRHEYEILKLKTTTLDKIIPEDVKIDIIRMDIQGYEFFALKGASRIIKKSPDIIIFMELDEVLKLYSDVHKEFSILIEDGFKFWTIEKNCTINPCSLEKLVVLSDKGVRDILISKLDLLKEYPELSISSA